MGNAAIKAVSKKGTDKINPPPHKSLLDVPVKVLFAKDAIKVAEQVAQPKKLYLIVNSASK